MTSRRRLAWWLVAAAAVLLLGRAFALLFAEHSWYTALGAEAMWREKLHDLAVIHFTSAVFSGLFALVNLYAIRRSIVSLALPRRLGNVEFGEEVPERVLDRAAFVLACAVAIVMAFAAPRWPRLAMIRSGIRFGEIDPFFQTDLSFFTGWLPLETDTYIWSLTLLVVVSGLVIGLYALTPSLRWQSGSFRVSVRVRRHLSILSALFLLTMAWSYRLDGFELLSQGSGPDGMFSYVDHQWLLPAYLSLSIGTVAAAALVLVSGWLGQVRAGFFTVSAVLIFSISLDLILPSVVKRLATASTPMAHERPYAATRTAFTARAYGLPRNPPASGAQSGPHEDTRFNAFMDSSHVARVMTAARDSALIYPGAYGAALAKHGRGVAAPLLGTGFRRLANSWAEQRLDLMWTDFPADTRIARRRDVRARVRSLFPIFAQGTQVIPAYVADSLVWILELYSASSSYPLSKHYRLAGEDRTYFRHSGTALVNSITGRVTVVPVPSPDPIAAGWRAHFPENIRAGAPDILDALTPTPRLPSVPILPSGAPGSDAGFKAEVTRLYSKMRAALAAGDLKAFGYAYDSLGALIGH